MTTADSLRAALKRLTIMASNELDTPGLWAHSRPQWDDAIAAARAALDAAPEGKPSDQELADPFAQCYLDSSALRGTSYLSGVRPAARATLAQPEPEVVGPTDNDLLACMIEAARSVPDGQAIGIADWDQEAIAAARAVLARWGRPAPAPVTDDDMDLLVIAIQALRPEASPDSHDLAAVDRGTEILRRWLTARGMA